MMQLSVKVIGYFSEPDGGELSPAFDGLISAWETIVGNVVG